MVEVSRRCCGGGGCLWLCLLSGRRYSSKYGSFGPGPLNGSHTRSSSKKRAVTSRSVVKQCWDAVLAKQVVGPLVLIGLKLCCEMTLAALRCMPCVVSCEHICTYSRLR